MLDLDLDQWSHSDMKYGDRDRDGSCTRQSCHLAQKAIAKYQRKRRQITMDAASVQLLDPRRLGIAVPGLGVNTS